MDFVKKVKNSKKKAHPAPKKKTDKSDDNNPLSLADICKTHLHVVLNTDLHQHISTKNKKLNDKIKTKCKKYWEKLKKHGKVGSHSLYGYFRSALTHIFAQVPSNPAQNSEYDQLTM